MDAVRLMLLASPPCTEPDLRSTARQMVDRGHRLRHHGRMTKRSAVHECADPDSRRVASERRMRRHGFEARVAHELGREEVVADGDRVEAELFDPGPDIAQLTDRGVLESCVNTEPQRHRPTVVGRGHEAREWGSR